MDHNTPPSVHPLVALLTVHFDTIMERERTNRGFVHLYGVGDYWVAFEQSAYPLCHLMPSCETALFHFASYPFPVVMASVTDTCLQSFVRQHILRTDRPAYKVFSVRPYPSARYRSWHRTLECALSLSDSSNTEPAGTSCRQTGRKNWSN